MPVLPLMLISFWIYPALSTAIAAQLDPVTLQVIQGDTSQFMQNFFNFNGLLFSFFASTTYTVLYQQQEQLYLALYAEVSEVRSLIEQLTLVAQNRPSYTEMLRSVSDYMQELLQGVRLHKPPAMLVSAKPASDPLENILHLTSVGVPSAVYDTVRSLRQARGARLGVTQRKLPSEHFVLLFVLGGLELLCFPLLGAGTSSSEPGDIIGQFGHVLWLQALIFSLLVGCVVMTVVVIRDLRSPSGGLYSLDAALVDMVGALSAELEQRLDFSRPLQEACLLANAASGEGSSRRNPLMSSLATVSRLASDQETVHESIDWGAVMPRADKQNVPMAIAWTVLIGLVAAWFFPMAVELIRSILSSQSLESIREDNNSQWLQNVFTGIGFVFSLFVTQTFAFLYGQQEQIYLALYTEVSEAKALLEQLALVCQTRASYADLLQGLQAYVRGDLERLDKRPAKLIASAASNDSLENVLYLTSVGVPSFVYETVRGLRRARGERLGATQQKLPKAHFLLLTVLGMFELAVFPVLSAGCSDLDAAMARAPGHILFFQSVLFGLMTSAVALTLIVLRDIWNPIGETYNVASVLEVMVRGLEEELALRLAEAQEHTLSPRVSAAADDAVEITDVRLENVSVSALP